MEKGISGDIIMLRMLIFFIDLEFQNGMYVFRSMEYLSQID